MPQPNMLVICGPTASGKTRMGVELALLHNGEVISADSMQVYRDMDIGTAKPGPAEMRGVPHHMLSVADPRESYSVARYADEAAACADDILSRGRLPVVVGGTGLYVDALVSGRPFASFSGTVRRSLALRAEREGVPALWEELRRIDPRRAERLPVTDARRILRALEIWYETGTTITEHDAATQALPPRYGAVYLGLSFALRADLRARIDRRVDDMMASGLAGEVRALAKAGVPRESTAMQAIGYKELRDALEEGRSETEAAEEIKLRSRQYAKRQLTWFRRNPSLRWLLWDKVPNISGAVQDATEYMEASGLL